MHISSVLSELQEVILDPDRHQLLLPLSSAVFIGLPTRHTEHLSTMPEAKFVILYLKCEPQARQHPCIDFSLTPPHLEVLPHRAKDGAGYGIHRRGSHRELLGPRQSQDAGGCQYSTGRSSCSSTLT